MATFHYPMRAAHFTAASSQQQQRASNASLQVSNTTDFTIAAWVYLDTVNVTRGIISRVDSGPVAEYGLFYDAAVGMRWRVHSTTSSVTVSSSVGLLPGGMWRFVVAQHDQANNQISISMDNGAFDTISKGAISITASAAKLRVGAYFGDANFMDGRLDSIGFWKRLLTTQERNFIYRNGVGVAYRDLPVSLKANLNLWLNEDGNGKDSSGLGNDVTDINGVTYVAGKR